MRFLALLAVIVGTPSAASEIAVISATAEATSSGHIFHVTLRHADSGWDHYADGWGIYAPDGRELGFRTLYHPHVDEQPFTRSLSGVRIPDGITQVEIRPRENVDGFNSPPFILKLSR